MQMMPLNIGQIHSGGSSKALDIHSRFVPLSLCSRLPLRLELLLSQGVHVVGVVACRTSEIGVIGAATVPMVGMVLKNPNALDGLAGA